MARLFTELSLYEMFFYLIGAWVVVDAWQRFVEVYAYDGLGMSIRSAYHNFIIAFVITGIFIILITAGQIIMQVDGNTMGDTLAVTPIAAFSPVLTAALSTATSNYNINNIINS